MGRSSQVREGSGGAPKWRTLLLVALMAVATLFVAACGSDDDEGDAGGSGTGAATTTTASDLSGEIGPAEQTDLKVAIPYPDATMYSFYIVAKDMGYYEEEGLNVEVITADNPIAGVVGGSAEVGVVDTGAAVDAIRKDLGITILSGHFCRQNYSFASQPDIQSVEGLDGQDIVLAGTTGDPQEFQRAKVLADEGWDLETVDANPVYPGPDSATWREFFVEGKVALMPFYDDDRDALEKYGANIVADTVRSWPNSVQVVKESWLEENPNTAVRFLRATMKAVQFITAPGIGKEPENQQKVLDIFEANGIEVEDLRKLDGPWALNGMMFCENLYWDDAAWDLTIETSELEPLEYDSDTSYLEKAQEDVGLDNTPAENLESIYP